MRLLIDKKDLELLLEKKREFIGNKVAIDTIIAGVSFLLSVFTASYDDILGIPGIDIKNDFLYDRYFILYEDSKRYFSYV